jgi:hypothetical protein
MLRQNRGDSDPPPSYDVLQATVDKIQRTVSINISIHRTFLYSDRATKICNSVQRS